VAPVLFRVPALFGVFRRVERHSLSYSSSLQCISSAVCALRTRWPQRALPPLLWDRPRRAAPPESPPAALRTGPVRTTATAFFHNTEHKTQTRMSRSILPAAAGLRSGCLGK